MITEYIATYLAGITLLGAAFAGFYLFAMLGVTVLTGVLVDMGLMWQIRRQLHALHKGTSELQTMMQEINEKCICKQANLKARDLLHTLKDSLEKFKDGVSDEIDRIRK